MGGGAYDMRKMHKKFAKNKVVGSARLFYCAPANTDPMKATPMTLTIAYSAGMPVMRLLTLRVQDCVATVLGKVNAHRTFLQMSELSDTLLDDLGTSRAELRRLELRFL